ncbi:hypothetical protein SDC9_206830 [bioreactor metagenome]|uniref:Uncharacterized protein n=1 Tax=bioreactor metagenome TaxID=1076179 RepID=A0A645J7K1_9ZZZZ
MAGWHSDSGRDRINGELWREQKHRTRGDAFACACRSAAGDSRKWDLCDFEQLAGCRPAKAAEVREASRNYGSSLYTGG